MKKYIFFLILIFPAILSYSQKRAREAGIKTGILSPGEYNAITDVAGVLVGHKTLIEGQATRTGVTVVLPHKGNLFRDKVPAAIYIGNGFGKLIGYSQVEELGNIETPIALTNTLSVFNAANGLIRHTIKHNKKVRSVNPVVGETNDGYLNQIQTRSVKPIHVLEAIENAHGGKTEEGNVGAGTGTVCFGFKGGIGTSSRVLPEKNGGYTVGVLVQTNFGGVLKINGAPIGKELDKYYMNEKRNDSPDGSCMIVVATDAPVDARNLKRMAKRAMLGLARTGGISSNGSGDYVIAFSNNANSGKVGDEKRQTGLVENNEMSPLFLAAIEATEEAILNSLFAAETMKGKKGRTVKALPEDEVIRIMDKKYNLITK